MGYHLIDGTASRFLNGTIDNLSIYHQGLTASEVSYLFTGEQPSEDTENGTPPALADNNHYDYGFRIYNPRIAKFLSVDPLTKNYPMLTPYQFASNTPIQAIDLDGLEDSTVAKLKDDYENMQGYEVSINKETYETVITKIELVNVSVSGWWLKNTVTGEFKQTEINMSGSGKIEKFIEYDFTVVGEKLLPGHLGHDLGFLTTSKKSNLTVNAITDLDIDIPSNSNFVNDSRNDVMFDPVVESMTNLLGNQERYWPMNLSETTFPASYWSYQDAFEVVYEFVAMKIADEDPLKAADNLTDKADRNSINLSFGIEDTKDFNAVINEINNAQPVKY